MENIYCLNILNEKVGILPSDLNNKKDIVNIIDEKLKRKIEGKCIKQGYVKKNSVKIINRSVGKIYDGHFTGDIVYKIKFSVEVCNPPESQIIDCVVYNINKMGILAGIGKNPKDSPLTILLPRHQHQEKDLFKELSVGDSISVEIIGKKFELNDNKIHIVASLINKNSNSDKTVTLKKKKKKKGGNIDKNMDISDKQNRDLRMQIVEKYIRVNQYYDGDLSDVIKLLKENVKIEIWDNMDVTEKNQKIDYCINYLEAEEYLKSSYGEKWNILTNVDKINLIKDKMEDKSNDSYEEIKEINGSNDSSDESSILEV